MCALSKNTDLCAQIISLNLSITLYWASKFYSQVSKMPSVICFIHLHSEQRELTDERFMCFGGVMRPGNTQTNLHRVPYSSRCLSVFRSLPLLTLNISDCVWARVNSHCGSLHIRALMQIWQMFDVKVLFVYLRGMKDIFRNWVHNKELHFSRKTRRKSTLSEKIVQNVLPLMVQQLVNRTVHLKGQYP